MGDDMILRLIGAAAVIYATHRAFRFIEQVARWRRIRRNALLTLYRGMNLDA